MNTASAEKLEAGPILIVDDEAGMRTALETNFSQRGWSVETAAGKGEALAHLRRRRPALLITDVRMPDGDGFELMQAAKNISPMTAVILLTAYGRVEDAVSAMKCGAREYLAKPVAFQQLLEAAQRVLSRPPQQDSAIVGTSPALQHALELADRAAQSNADILIEAESGTGKELLARRIHRLSARGRNPLIAVNCAALPEALQESELFGYSRGAFTGAAETRPGKFQLADGGTLLLDEVGEMPLNLQPKLLRALQEREFYPLGASRSVKVNVRVIATTNRSLEELVRAGKFRTDLYYRLNVLSLSLPPLRARGEDVRELALHFAGCFAGPGGRELPEAFLRELPRHSWPGNVRELANLVQRAMVFEQPCLPSGLPVLAEQVILPGNRAGIRAADSAWVAPGMSLAAAERHLLEITLEATSGNRSRAAEMLGISLRTVRNKIREYHLPSRSSYVHD